MVSITHHRNQHIQQQNMHQNHKNNKNHFGEIMIINLVKLNKLLPEQRLNGKNYQKVERQLKGNFLIAYSSLELAQCHLKCDHDSLFKTLHCGHL